MSIKPVQEPVSPARQAWLDIAKCWEQLHCGLIDRYEFNLKWAEFMHKKETLRCRSLRRMRGERDE